MNHRTIIPSDIEYFSPEHVLNLLHVVAAERDELFLALQNEQAKSAAAAAQVVAAAAAAPAFPTNDGFGFPYPVTDTADQQQQQQQHPSHAPPMHNTNHNHNGHAHNNNIGHNNNNDTAMNNTTTNMNNPNNLTNNLNNNIQNQNQNQHPPNNNNAGHYSSHAYAHQHHHQRHATILGTHATHPYHQTTNNTNSNSNSNNNTIPATFKVDAIKKRIAKKSYTLVKKTAHSKCKKPYTEIHEALPNAACALALFQMGGRGSGGVGFEPKSDTSRLVKWELNGDQVIEWLGVTNNYIHPVKFDGKVISFGSRKPFVYAWAKYLSLQAKYDKKGGSLQLKFRTIMIGSGRPTEGSDIPPSLDV